MQDRTAQCPDCGTDVVAKGRGPIPRCQECKRLRRNRQALEWRNANLDKCRERTRQSMTSLRERDPQAARDKKRAHAYGITAAVFAEMLAEQGGTCAICQTRDNGARPMHIDHDHACCPGARTCGKCIRGLLCNRCNTALGFMADDPRLLRAAADYLDQHKESNV